MSLAPGDLPLTALAARATVRLIPAASYKPPVLSPLVDTEADMAALVALEGLTSARLAGEREGLSDLDPRELAFRARAAGLARWGHTHVNAAFLYTRAGGNRFNGEGRGAWYAAFDDLTAIEEVGFHRTRELGFVGVFEDAAVYQALLADFIGEVPDLRPVRPLPGCLDPDPAIGYPAGQALARALRAAGHAVLLYPSVRRAGGTCLAAFEPQIVQNVRPGARWRLVWDGAPAFSVAGDPAPRTDA